MDERQEKKFAAYAEQYAATVKSNAPEAKRKALDLLMRMALTAIHPEPDDAARFDDGLQRDTQKN